MEENVVFEWKAMDRPHKVWSRDFYSTVIVLAFLVSVIMFFIEGLLPVLVVWAVVFAMWQMNKVEPKEEEYAINTWGIRTKERTYRWEEMNTFWFEDKWGSRLLRVLTNRVPWQLILVIKKEDEEEIKKLIVENVAYEEPKQTWMDRMVKWFGEKLPLE